MKIYKGNVGIDLTVDAFLDLLEEDALDEAVNMVLDLEATGSIKDDYEGEIVYLGAVDLGDYDGDISGLFDHINNNLEHYEVISEEDFEAAFGTSLTEGFATEDDLMDNLLLSNEDLRVKRIVQRFRHINDAS